MQAEIPKISSKPSYFMWTGHYGFRLGKHAEIIGVRTIELPFNEKRPCYVLLYEDGFIDYVPLSQNPENYTIT